MQKEHLLTHPLCHAEDLGKPIPNSKHAISMCLPRWQDVIGYEERDPVTMEKLQLGYPRFLYHPLVQQAFDQIGEHVQIYTTAEAAKRCRSYLLKKNPNAKVECHGNQIHFSENCSDDARAYWQHAGEGISSRHAEALIHQTPPPNATVARGEIKNRLADFTGVAAENIFLFPSGMAAIHTAFLMVQSLAPHRPSAQFSFPYGDTLKLQNKLGSQSALFYPRGDAADFQSLETALQANPISGLFCEFPTNPLLTCIDLPRLRALANQHHFPIIIDETLGACINQNTHPCADLSVISLTKYFSGSGEVMGGALLLNPDAPFAEAFTEQLKRLHDPEACHPADLIQLEIDSRDCRKRVTQINDTALEVSTFLDQHPAVKSVYYPALGNREIYDPFKRPDGGYGGLLSFVLTNASKHTEAFYDALEITKGPNLGTRFSLCCPFTLLAHYDELDWAEAAGASRHLIRISIGLEPPNELIQRLERAFL